MLILEIMNELENTKEQKEELTEQKCFTRNTKVNMILQSLKLYEALEMLLRIA